MPKPRKRRTQTLADKGADEGACYYWQEVLDAFVFTPSPKVWATIKEIDGSWVMTVVIYEKRYMGERATLEAAYRATADLLYKHAKEFWLKMDARAVTETYAHDLPKAEQ